MIVFILKWFLTRLNCGRSDEIISDGLNFKIMPAYKQMVADVPMVLIFAKAIWDLFKTCGVHVNCFPPSYNKETHFKALASMPRVFIVEEADGVEVFY